MISQTAGIPRSTNHWHCGPCQPALQQVARWLRDRVRLGSGRARYVRQGLLRSRDHGVPRGGGRRPKGEPARKVLIEAFEKRRPHAGQHARVQLAEQRRGWSFGNTFRRHYVSHMDLGDARTGGIFVESCYVDRKPRQSFRTSPSTRCDHVDACHPASDSTRQTNAASRSVEFASEKLYSLNGLKCSDCDSQAAIKIAAIPSTHCSKARNR